MQPGEVIDPNQDNNNPQTNQAQSAPPSSQQLQQEQNTFEASGFDDSSYVEHTQQPQSEQAQSQLPNPEVAWSASEYIAHQKPVSWYTGLGFVSAVLAGLVYLIADDILSAVIVLLALIMFGIFATRRPQVLNYIADSSGITIGDKHYEYENFKSFAVFQEGNLLSAHLMPTKRFMPGLTLYLPPDQEEEIVDTLSLYLPHEDREPDAVDRLMKRVRF